MRSSQEFIEEARKEIPEVTVSDVEQMLNTDQDFILLDVRDNDEYRAGYIPSSTYVSRGMLEFEIEDYVTERDKPIVVYCAGGFRSLLAAQVLKRMGYTDTTSMSGGFRAWSNAGNQVDKPMQMTPDQLERYSRHFMLQEVGEEGQAKLLNSKVLLTGAGGLGSPAAVYLAASGVGTIGIVDSDIVDRSNLQRQILHHTGDVDKSKVQSSVETINSMNPDINVVPHLLRLDESNVMEIFEQYDLILDGTDNFATRYLINDAAVLLNKTVVHGSIFQFEGQLTVFDPTQGPCYRCMFPIPPPPGLVPS
ncbi:TPA: molybdopterin biosynthesis protein MoeB [Candidatus Poribacteria bacterium]|jgi:molybdopterin/thiamine biosynthesis adenylyltransferase/rhodanese-related sulfurtransferase|nr:molybdopterin biosynthesis protein MoeB [Candidatus Poribacteria bacterium]HIB89790.1 molybdopterin biosynthesis protein MoeB [Candidatus Poribacteria bacterium]HIC01360.1 molybdopterin biosynthesis protein MoeB [Candidatus Poribacteria bacterium]HIO78101.1 molybdopterin biosynthesis protein MoeB [Candidatus Poribacteria bacterium]